MITHKGHGGASHVLWMPMMMWWNNTCHARLVLYVKYLCARSWVLCGFYAREHLSYQSCLSIDFPWSGLTYCSANGTRSEENMACPRHLLFVTIS